ncbi:MAG: DUF2071 domain-containing protein [Verrucomicrobia bacterium]|nr:DUF2071 domain-containing protein [Verrucomicrobiota bacterium]
MPTLEQRLAERVRPRGLEVMHQAWEHLLFLHWRVEPEVVQRTLPAGLTVDTFDGSAWVGLVPFYMSRIRPSFLPPVPWISWFLELNVRTYACDERGRPGVWFYSLDCNRPPAVWLARTFFHLPYEHARMQAETNAGRTAYRSLRRGEAEPTEFAWREVGEPFEATPGTLEFYLAERYRLFAVTPQGRIRSGCVHHVPYPLRQVEVEKFDTQLLELNGFAAPHRPPDHACGSRGVEVEIFALGAAGE